MESIDNKNAIDKEIQEDEKLKQSNEPLLTEKYKKKCDCPHFLLKLYEILENKEYKDIIHWSEDGKYFIVQNLHDFTEKILPKYYKHNNFSSFIRQLNMYDFHKKKSSQNEHIFHHNNFIKDRKDLIKTIKRKSKKENIPMNTYAPNNKIFNIKQTNLIPVSSLNLFNNINNGINNSINNRKSSLSIDDDVNLTNSVHSLFESNTRPLLPMGLPSSTYENSIKNNNINNNGNSNNINSNNYNNFSNGLNGIGNVNYNMNALNDDKKVTKKNLQHLLTYLMTSIEENTEKEKQLELKIERLSKQNEEFITQNQKILQEIISKGDYNKKLEAVICFILEMFMSKPKIKSNSESKNLFLSNESSNKFPNINKINKLDNLGIVNFSSNHDTNGILSQNDFMPTSDAGLEPFQNFLNKYLDKKKNTTLLTNIESNYNNNKNLLSDIEENKYPKICSENEGAIQNMNAQNNNNISTSTDLICRKRKRSASFNSILSNLSGGTNVIYDNSYKNKSMGNENIEEVEEKKIDNENINADNSLNSDLLDNSWNKSKNAFDIDLNQEESKSDFSDWNKDLLNNSQSSINDIYNSSNINKDNEFSDLNN